MNDEQESGLPRPILNTLNLWRIKSLWRGDRVGVYSQVFPVPEVPRDEIQMPQGCADRISVTNGDYVLVSVDLKKHTVEVFFALRVLIHEDVDFPLVRPSVFDALGLNVELDFDVVSIIPAAPTKWAKIQQYLPTNALAQTRRGELVGPPLRYVLAERNFAMELGYFDESLDPPEVLPPGLEGFSPSTYMDPKTGENLAHIEIEPLEISVVGMPSLVLDCFLGSVSRTVYAVDKSVLNCGYYFHVELSEEEFLATAETLRQNRRED